MLSSSFIEEEHQTWYFLTQTMNLMLFVKTAVLFFCSTDGREPVVATSVGRSCDTQGHYYVPSGREHANEINNPNDRCTIRAGKRLSASKTEAHVENNILSRPAVFSVSNILSALIGYKTTFKSHQKYALGMIYCFLLALLCRLCRSWNQTGDKWSHLPDVGDWLIAPVNKQLLSMCCFVSLLLACIVLSRSQVQLHWMQKLLFCYGAVAVYCYRAAIGDVTFDLLYDHSMTSK